MDNSFEWMFLNKNPKNTTRVVLSLRAMALPKDFPCESKLSQNKSFQNLHPTDYDPLSWKNPANAKKLIFPCFVFQWSETERCFSSGDVLSCEATCADVRACVGACSQTQSCDIGTDARRAKTSEEWFLWFL